jgi:hypothetical protein
LSASFGSLSDGFDRLVPVEEVLDHVPAGDDDVIVPAALAVGRGQRRVVGELADGRGFAVVADRDLVADVAEVLALLG